jgi:Spy/CpxP family protein refolding chaperone
VRITDTTTLFAGPFRLSLERISRPSQINQKGDVMNKLTPSLATFFLAAQLPAPLRAQSDRRGPPDPQKMDAMRAQHQEKMLERMTKKLSLTADQQKSVKAALDKQHEQMKSLRRDAMADRKKVREETDADILKVLNDDQKKQFEQWKTERKEKIKEHMDERSK